MHRELRWYWRDHDFPRLRLAERLRLERANAAVLERHLAAFDPDVVMWWAMGGMSLSLLEQVRRRAIPAVGVVGDNWMVYGPQVDQWMRVWRGRRRRFAATAERLVAVPARLELDRAARWTFNSRFTLDSARRAGWRLPDAAIIHPGIDTRLFQFSEPGQWRWRLLYCGRVEPRKGVASAIEALAELPEQSTLAVQGDGPSGHRLALQSLAGKLGVADRVEFRFSSHDDIPAAYAAADAVLFPVQWEEPWGLVPLEAMAVGRPVIASRAGGGAAEYLVDGENCLQFPPGNAMALADVLRRLAAAPELRADLLAAGRRTARRFTASAFHQTLERELERAAAGA